MVAERTKAPDWFRDLIGVAFAIIAILLASAAWVVHSHFEARAYNRQTGAAVSTWDAMFLDLRVQAGPK